MTAREAISPALATLLRQTADLLAATPVLAGFADGLTGLPLGPARPKPLPFLPLLADTPPLASKHTRPMVEAICAAAAHLEWRQSYAEAQVGADYLARYGWANIAAPDGSFAAQDMRLSVGYWGRGLHYLRHWHEPEETYLVLAGGAVFHTDGRAPVQAGPGTLIHHPSNLPHAMDMAEGPLLALAVWTGNALTKVSQIEATHA